MFQQELEAQPISKVGAMCLDCVARANSEHLEHFLQRFSQRRRDREQEVRIWEENLSLLADRSRHKQVDGKVTKPKKKRKLGQLRLCMLDACSFTTKYHWFHRLQSYHG